MTLDFPIPDYREHYRTRPTHYVGMYWLKKVIQVLFCLMIQMLPFLSNLSYILLDAFSEI